MKTLVVDDKWMANLEERIAGEMARVAQALTRRVKELGDRYGDDRCRSLEARVAELEKAVAGHLAKMGVRMSDLRPGYKLTEVGVIPATWEIVTTLGRMRGASPVGRVGSPLAYPGQTHRSLSVPEGF